MQQSGSEESQQHLLSEVCSKGTPTEGICTCRKSCHFNMFKESPEININKEEELEI